jgi:hypothetical protein
MTITFPKFLLFVDITWLLLWFPVLLWFESAYPALDAYRIQMRLIYRHIVCSLALLYVISNKTATDRLLGILPFIFALLDDIINAINIINRITPIEDQVAYNFSAALTWMALSVSILATFWYLVKYSQSREGR